jgi:hypothetical protein
VATDGHITAGDQHLAFSSWPTAGDQKAWPPLPETEIPPAGIRGQD